MGRTWVGWSVVLVSSLVAGGVVSSPGTAVADSPLAVPRDLGTGPGTTSRTVAVAGRTAVGDVGGVPVGVRWLSQVDLDAPGASMTRLDDAAFQSNISSIADADGPYVVGGQQAGTASRSAFVVDLRTQTSTSLPRLGGLRAGATAVDRGVVVGSSETDAGSTHAFAYDVDGERVVLDLGTLGGPDSTALDVSGDLVVGQADGTDLAGHAFAVDLAAPGRPMADLGTSGGAESAATAVDGDVVVGWTESPRGVRHAFAVRGGGPATTGQLGSLGGATSEATDVDGEIVVGTSTRADGTVGIWWTDLRTVPYVLHDLGTPAAGSPAPRAVEGRVVGTRQTAVGDRGFVLDVASGEVVELDPQPGLVRTEAVDVAGATVVGTSYGVPGGTDARATAWTLETVADPSFRLARRTTKASEGATARIKVVRTGDVRQAVEVRYRVDGTRRGATRGRDFRGGRGVVRFAAGRTEAWITVRIRDDKLREKAEKARVTLVKPSPGTSLVGRSRAWLTIRASDRRPGRGR